MLVTYPRDGRICWVWEQYGRQWILYSRGDAAAGGKGECVVSWYVLARRCVPRATLIRRDERGRHVPPDARCSLLYGACPSVATERDSN